MLAREELWGRSVALVAIPSSSRIERVAAEELTCLEERTWEQAELTGRAETSLAWRASAQGEPLAIARGGVEPLPHQLAILQRALATSPLRLLLADEVGLGKTIEAGLIITELKARGLLHRVLVVAPKGVQLQWVAEMADRFDEQFVLVGPGGVPLESGVDPWRTFDQVICSLDTVKPLQARRGWSPERVAAFNDRRLHAVAEAGWDLVVIDEAHHVAGSGEDVARHQLARRLAGAVPNVLLLTATPHSGKRDAFARLLGLLDDGFFHGRPVLRENVAPLVARTEKRRAIDRAGQPLFRPRATHLMIVPYGARAVEEDLYEAVTSYVRHGYRRSIDERRPAVGFLVLLMQRLVSSSTAAIWAALERRLAALAMESAEPQRLFTDDSAEWRELTGEEQEVALGSARRPAWTGERTELEALLELAKKASSDGLDAKARYLLDLVGRVARSEGDPSTKVVLFTEFVPTQRMLLELFASAGIPAVGIDGSMSIGERRDAQDAFRDSARVLVSTDAGGEGVNLQFAHIVVNYDLPWSPTRLEQRIGRVDRIGQSADVAAYNLALESSIDARVLEVLEAKLAVILEELGIDKSSDVLASIDDRVEGLYTTAIMEPDRLRSAVEALGDDSQSEVAEVSPLRDALGPGISVERLSTPGSLRQWLALVEGAVADLHDKGHRAGRELPEVLAGEPVPQVDCETIGWWTMWEISAGSGRSVLPLFISDGGTIRPDLAERLWVELAERPSVASTEVLDHGTYDRLRRFAVDHGYQRAEAPPSLVLRLAVRACR